MADLRRAPAPERPTPESLVEATLARLSERARHPRATYRLQLGPALRFRDAAAIVPYLAALGVSDAYLSPYLRAAPGSTHGYDIVDHQTVNPELGEEGDLDALEQALARHGMGALLDVVPNHMGIGSGNPLWMDVLENGPSSPAAVFFDIDWRPVKEELRGKVLLPILGDQYGRVLERGELSVSQAGGAFELTYHDQRFPLDPREYPRLLAHRLPELHSRLASDTETLQDYESLINAFGHLPAARETEPSRAAERQREKEVHKRRLQRLCERSEIVARFIAENVADVNGRTGDPASFDRLDALLDAQVYRLAHWRVAGEEVNYRRFFDIDRLAAIRVEDPVVFEEVHRRIFERIRGGRATGLRIDHPDGLYDPTQYFRRLQIRYALEVARELAGGAWEAVEPVVRERFAALARDPSFRPLYVVAEKILFPGEKLPSEWAVHGTTGYEFLNAVSAIFVRTENAPPFDRLYAAVRGERVDFPELSYRGKRLILESTMSSEIHVLARQLNRISETDRRTRDFTLGSLTTALVELCAAFPVYRTYLREGDEPIDERDRRHIQSALDRARRRNPNQSASLYEFLGDVLLRRGETDLSEPQRRERRHFALRLQQLTAPVTARGVEDTAFYRYNRLVSLNEVGGEPDRFGAPVSAFHARNEERTRATPYSLLATATHDTKRGEDVRARLHALSELPSEWEARLSRWREMNRPHLAADGDDPVPDPDAELLLYQTLLGVWPFGELNERAWGDLLRRIEGYLVKAAREAKVHTSWINQDPAYEEALVAFLRHVLPKEPPPRQTTPFLDDFLPFERRIARCGVMTSLSQLLLKAASPGVPDFYQGTELWDLSLVDPDNRRSVDFKLRARFLREIRADAEKPAHRAVMARALFTRPDDGRLKLFSTWLLLQARAAPGSPLAGGDYLPLSASGVQEERVVAFARRLGPRTDVAVAPRLVAGLLGGEGQTLDPAATWGDTWLALPEGLAGEPLELFTGLPVRIERAGGRIGVPLAELLGTFPIALVQWGEG